MRTGLTVLVVPVLTLSAGAQTCDPMTLFAPKVEYLAGESPRDIESADLDNDGNMDIVFALSGERNIGVLMGNGDGTFSARTLFPVDTFAYSVALGDMNNDGHLDAVVGHTATTYVSVLLGDGAGNFGAPTQQNSGSGGLHEEIVLVDTDQDSNLDVIVVTNANQIRVLSGDGAGNLVGVDLVIFGLDSTSVVAGHLNNDSDIDLLVGHRSVGSAFVLLGGPGSSFIVSAPINLGFFVYGLDLGDMDNDGDLDFVAVGSLSSTGAVYLNSGVGSFALSQSMSLGIVPSGVVVGDFDSDGNNDAVASLQIADTVALMTGNGDGTVDPQIDFSSSNGGRDVIAADFNNDGALDVANIGDPGDFVTIHLNTCAPMCAPDLNGDTMLDFFDLSALLQNMIDFNGDTVFDFFDVSAFLQSYQQGCP